MTDRPTLPALRQVVLLSSDLARTLRHTREFLGLHQGVREEHAMAALGFEHEVLAIDRTFVEVVAPLSADSSPGRLLDRHGESGYMVVLQVDDLDAVVARAAAAGLAPIMREVLDGNPISQWHPRDLGTLAEIDEILPGGEWHFCPALTDTGSTQVVADIESVAIAAGDPAECAARWATLLDLTVARDATSVDLGYGRLRFVPTDQGRPGLRQVTFRPAPGASGSKTPTSDAETVISGVRLLVTERENT